MSTTFLIAAEWKICFQPAGATTIGATGMRRQQVDSAAPDAHLARTLVTHTPCAGIGHGLRRQNDPVRSGPDFGWRQPAPIQRWCR